jgi:hypothetical protein
MTGPDTAPSDQEAYEFSEERLSAARNYLLCMPLSPSENPGRFLSDSIL